MEEIVIILQKEKKDANIKILLNGQILPGIKSFNLDFNENQLKFNGVKCKTDRSGQFYVDEKTKETAIEDVNMLNFLENNYVNYYITESYKKAIDWELKNIKMTSYLNAQNYIKEMAGIINEK